MPSGSSLCPETWMGTEKLVFSLYRKWKGASRGQGPGAE